MACVSAILSGHFNATKTRYASCEGPILLLQDTTEFTYQRRNPHAVGFTKSVNRGRDGTGRLRHHAVCGILMHSSLAVTEEGLPLGLSAVKFWNRDKFKGTAQLKRKVNPTRVPIEAKESVRWLDNLRQSLSLLGQPERCVHVGDRESDIYELYCLARDLGTHSRQALWPSAMIVNQPHQTANEQTFRTSARGRLQSFRPTRRRSLFSRACTAINSRVRSAIAACSAKESFAMVTAHDVATAAPPSF